jgi:hypothetical protein
MSGDATSTNLELLRGIYAGWERGDFFDTSWADPEIEFAIVGGPTDGTATGIPALAVAWTDFMRAWQDLRAELEEARPLDDERILVFTRNTGRGKTSGVELGELETYGANLFRIVDGRVTELVCYFDRERAIRELGPAAQERGVS